MVTRLLEQLALDLSPYGFRYGRATQMHADGYSLEAIAEALVDRRHVQTSTARGYIYDFDPDADGWAGRAAELLDARLTLDELEATQ
jgi:hypothetical protein